MDEDELRAKVSKLEQERDAALTRCSRILEKWRDEIGRTGDLRFALHVMLMSASPNKRDNPTMYEAWEIGRAALIKAQEDL